MTCSLKLVVLRAQWLPAIVKGEARSTALASMVRGRTFFIVLYLLSSVYKDTFGCLIQITDQLLSPLSDELWSGAQERWGNFSFRKNLGQGPQVLRGQQLSFASSSQ